MHDQDDDPDDSSQDQPRPSYLLYREREQPLGALIRSFTAAAALLMDEARMTQSTIDQLHMVPPGEVLDATKPDEDVCECILQVCDRLLILSKQLVRLYDAINLRRHEIAGGALPPPDAPDPGPAGN